MSTITGLGARPTLGGSSRPGWEITKMRPGFFKDGYGMIVGIMGFGAV